MRYKIVVDSCCELPQDLKQDDRFEVVPLTLMVGETYEKEDDGSFNQREFLDAVALRGCLLKHLRNSSFVKTFSLLYEAIPHLLKLSAYCFS